MSVFEGRADGSGLRVCIVASRFNRLATDRLVRGARQALLDAGAEADSVDTAWVPGAWELPWGARRAVGAGYDAVVAVGCVVRGETPHFEYICRAATRGLGELSARGGTPVTFGVLTCDTMEQAMERAGGEHGNKGAEAAEAALELCTLARDFG